MLIGQQIRAYKEAEVCHNCNMEWQTKVSHMSDIDIYHHYKHKYNITKSNIQKIKTMKPLPCWFRPWYLSDLSINGLLLVLMIVSTVDLFLSPLKSLDVIMIWDCIFMSQSISLAYMQVEPTFVETDRSVCKDHINIHYLFYRRMLILLITIFMLYLSVSTLIVEVRLSISQDPILYYTLVLLTGLSLIGNPVLALLVRHYHYQNRSVKNLWELYISKCEDEEKYYHRVKWFRV